MVTNTGNSISTDNTFSNGSYYSHVHCVQNILAGSFVIQYIIKHCKDKTKRFLTVDR